MAKLKLQPDPTFRAKVHIGVPGSDDAEVEFTFKYRNRDEFLSFLDPLQKDGAAFDTDLVMAMCNGWDLLDAFTAENVGLLCLNYVSAPRAIFEAYGKELTKARAKN
jgi:hypothetical protein